MTFVPQASLTHTVSVSGANWRQNDLCWGAKCCHFSASALWAPRGRPPTLNRPTPSEEEHPAALPPPQVSHTRECECFLSPLWAIASIWHSSGKSQQWKKRNTYLLRLCVCLCVMVACGRVDRSDRGLIFYSWKWCPHPAISVTQSPWVSITGCGAIKKKSKRKEKKHVVKRMFFYVSEWSADWPVRGGSGEKWHTCDYLCIRGDDKGLTAQGSFKRAVKH